MLSWIGHMTITGYIHIGSTITNVKSLERLLLWLLSFCLCFIRVHFNLGLIFDFGRKWQRSFWREKRKSMPILMGLLLLLSGVTSNVSFSKAKICPNFPKCIHAVCENDLTLQILIQNYYITPSPCVKVVQSEYDLRDQF